MLPGLVLCYFYQNGKISNTNAVHIMKSMTPTISLSRAPAEIAINLESIRLAHETVAKESPDVPLPKN